MYVYVRTHALLTGPYNQPAPGTHTLTGHSLMQILAVLFHSDLNNASQSGHLDVKKNL